MTEKRKKLLDKLSNYHMVPGHGPDLSKMTDSQLEKQLKIYESLFRLAFSEKNEEEDEDI
ncbi:MULTISPECIES: hypothetical protein [Bacillus amyloliquefaciens group]|uniref:hypothetical protein n=1 Tax=Bacillus amyloliquefaciens group TaxID=1938374 RepID=UPI002E23C293|nr:hypothetical protein [Bacillus siamensis]MED0778013.1 hypothetical protein [Bacillus siamensis]MED0832757.1 hypothetical protein [Bacillus siamensis]